MRRVEFSRMDDNALCYIMYEGNVKRIVERRSKLPEHVRSQCVSRSTQPTRHEEVDGRM